MPRSFRAASNQYLRTATPPVTVLPLTISVWARAYELTQGCVLVMLSDEAVSTDAWYVELSGSTANDPFLAQSAASGTYSEASSSPYPYRTNEWVHVCGVYTSTTSRDIWARGVLRGSRAGFSNPTGIVALNVGRFMGNVSAPGTADIGPIAIYNAALTGAEILRLSEGADPRTVRRGSLVAFWKMDQNGGNETDLISGNVLVATNEPGFVPRPRHKWRYLEDREKRTRFASLATFGPALSSASTSPFSPGSTVTLAGTLLDQAGAGVQIQKNLSSDVFDALTSYSPSSSIAATGIIPNRPTRVPYTTASHTVQFESTSNGVPTGSRTATVTLNPPSGYSVVEIVTPDLTSASLLSYLGWTAVATDQLEWQSSVVVGDTTVAITVNDDGTWSYVSTYTVGGAPAPLPSFSWQYRAWDSTSKTWTSLATVLVGVAGGITSTVRPSIRSSIRSAVRGTIH